MRTWRTRALVALELMLCLGGAPFGGPAFGADRIKQQAAALPQASASGGAASSGAHQASEVTAYTLPPDLYAKAVKFSRAQYDLYFVDTGWSIIVLLLVLAWKLAPRYRDWAERAAGNRFVQSVIFAPLFLFTLAILELPVGIYGHWLSRSYGISVQHWGSWLGDWAKGQILTYILGIILIWILYAVIRKSARRWWFYFWLASLPILIFVLFISPWVIDPLFDKFEPLQPVHPELVSSLEGVVNRAGMSIPPDRMFLMKASEKVTAVDAYVTGFGASKRVVVLDTTISKMNPDQIAFVFGHEMGHYVLYHIPKGLLFFAALLLVLFYIGYRVATGVVSQQGPRWSMRGIDDWASLPVLLLILTILAFVASPLFNGYSRHQEHEADRYGLEVTHGLIPDSSQVAAQAFEILGTVDLADPHPSPFIEFWLLNHPSIPDRIRFSLDYRPWAQGQEPHYVK